MIHVMTRSGFHSCLPFVCFRSGGFGVPVVQFALRAQQVATSGAAADALFPAAAFGVVQLHVGVGPGVVEQLPAEDQAMGGELLVWVPVLVLVQDVKPVVPLVLGLCVLM